MLKAIHIDQLLWLFIIVSIVLVIELFVTGSVLSQQQNPQKFLVIIHEISPALILISCLGVFLFRL